MAERALRGTRLGATSYENDRNTDLAPRQEVAFDCPKGHRFSVPFAAEAEVPAKWECRVCGATAITATGDEPTAAKVKPPRSHWDMLHGAAHHRRPRRGARRAAGHHQGPARRARAERDVVSSAQERLAGRELHWAPGSAGYAVRALFATPH